MLTKHCEWISLAFQKTGEKKEEENQFMAPRLTMGALGIKINLSRKHKRPKRKKRKENFSRCRRESEREEFSLLPPNVPLCYRSCQFWRPPTTSYFLLLPALFLFFLLPSCVFVCVNCWRQSSKNTFYVYDWRPHSDSLLHISQSDCTLALEKSSSWFS